MPVAVPAVSVHPDGIKLPGLNDTPGRDRRGEHSR